MPSQPTDQSTKRLLWGGDVELGEEEILTHSMEHEPTLPSLRDATPASADIRLLSDLRPTIPELLTFFPNHLAEWPTFAIRLCNSGWTVEEVAKYVNWSRDLIGDEMLTARELNTVVFAARHTFSQNLPKRFIQALEEPTVNNWMLPEHNTKRDSPPADVPLTWLARGVVHWPTGDARRELTRAIELTLDGKKRRLRLSDVPNVVDSLIRDRITPFDDLIHSDEALKAPAMKLANDPFRFVLLDRKWGGYAHHEGKIREH